MSPFVCRNNSGDQIKRELLFGSTVIAVDDESNALIDEGEVCELGSISILFDAHAAKAFKQLSIVRSWLPVAIEHFVVKIVVPVVVEEGHGARSTSCGLVGSVVDAAKESGLLGDGIVAISFKTGLVKDLTNV